ncbi:MAG: hypothetical protein VR72_13935 [Clostridiaceae bacterium BRH_c20a]|nr:MAG: hypothetical protein VR72_13935 [Clostridiaceae bacterium BRH_c20a]
MNNKKILIIDDEPEISQLIEKYLTRERFIVFIADTAGKALEMLALEKPHLIILDILLPDTDGVELCRQLREETEVPIIFISCKDDISDKILALGMGGDDYVTKPFSPKEVVARVKAHLRRSNISNSYKKKSSTLTFPGLIIDQSSYSVIINDERITLPAKEFQLLNILARNPNILFTTNQLFDMVWHEDHIGDLRTVVVHISNLRKKVEKDPTNPRFIVTVRNVGYKFNPNP